MYFMHSSLEVWYINECSHIHFLTVAIRFPLLVYNGLVWHVLPYFLPTTMWLSQLAQEVGDSNSTQTGDVYTNTVFTGLYIGLDIICCMSHIPQNQS